MTQATHDNRHPFVQLLDYAKIYKRRITIATTYSILGKIFDIAPPALIGVAVDIVVEQQDSLLGKLGVTDITMQLIILGILTLVICSFCKL